MSETEKTVGQQRFEYLSKWGGPAYPYTEHYADGSFQTFTGLTVRDWFAGMALCGLMSVNSPRPFEDEARRAYAAADAMLKERARIEAEER